MESHACKSHVTGNMCHELMDELRLIAIDKLAKVN